MLKLLSKMTAIIIVLLLSIMIYADETKNKEKVFTTVAKRKNPKERDFPGGRAADMIVIYTPEFGERTGTNQWGAEAVVVQNVVVRVGGNNSEIPKDGFVLSSHGVGAEWIREHIKKGMKVDIDGMNITVRVSAISEIYDANDAINNAEEFFKEKYGIDNIKKKAEESKKAANFLEKIKKAKKLLVKANKLNSKDNENKAINLALESKRIANDLFYDEIDSKDVELRGVWHRLTEKNPEELIKTLDRLKEGHFNAIFPETWYHGMTIYPSEVVDQLPQFKGWDPMKVLVEEGKKRGIEVHPWMECFFVGVDEKHSLEYYKDWLAVNREGKIISELEEGYIYLCPSREESRQLVLNVYKELVSKYDIDGLQLDYVRYPRSKPYEKGYCYCEHCQEEFKKKYGVNPLDITPTNNPEMWEKWRKWREDNITTFVEKTVKELKAIKKDLEISAAVFPEYEQSLNEIMQNWKLWIDKGWLDFVCPMIYSDDIEWVDKMSKEFIEKAKVIPVAPGIAPFMKIPPNNIMYQIIALRKNGAAGVVMFALHSVTDDLINALKKGPFREVAKTGIKAKDK